MANNEFGKLWSSANEVNKQVEKFTIGNDADFDLHLAPFDVVGSMAHAIMLGESGLLSKEEAGQLLCELKQIFTNIQAEDFEIEAGVEDVHSQVEILLTRKLGDTGKRIHTARSRNDQVLVDLKLFLRNEVEVIAQQVIDLVNILTNKADEFKEVGLPGYTHMQAAMPSTFGIWFSAYAEALLDDLELGEGIKTYINKNPLGSAAGYGSSFPINRTRTTELLEFDDLHVNVVNAQFSRGKTERQMAWFLSTIAQTLNKLASDVCQYVSQNFGFMKLDPLFTTGSSIMPHKKNPDVFELIRGRTNVIQALPQELTLLLTNLPSGYHREFQLTKEHLFPAIESLKETLSITHLALHKLTMRDDILDDERYDTLYSVERVHELVREGLPFRDAYKKVAQEVEDGSFKRPQNLKHTHEGSAGNLQLKKLREKTEQIAATYRFVSVDDLAEKLSGESPSSV